MSLGDREPRERLRARRVRPHDRRHPGQIAGERHGEQVHLQQTGRRDVPHLERVWHLAEIGLDADASDRRLGVQTHLDVADRREVRLELHAVGRAELRQEPMIIRRDRVEDQVPLCHFARLELRVGGDVAKDPGEGRLGVVLRRDRLRGSAVGDPGADVRTRRVYAELERTKFRRAADRVGDRLVDRDAVGPAGRQPVVAGKATFLELPARQRLPRALLVGVARPLVGGQRVDAVEHHDVRLVRLERREDRRQCECVLAPLRPPILHDRAIGGPEHDEAFWGLAAELLRDRRSWVAAAHDLEEREREASAPEAPEGGSARQGGLSHGESPASGVAWR